MTLRGRRGVAGEGAQMAVVPVGGHGPGHGASEPRKVQGGEHMEPRAAAGGGKPGRCARGGISLEERGGGQRTFSNEEHRPFQSSEQEQDCKPCKDGGVPVRGLLQAVS